MSSYNDTRSTFGLAGWLLADLLLGLSMFFFVADSRGRLPAPTPTETLMPTIPLTPIPTMTLTPTPTMTPTTIPTSTFTPSATHSHVATQRAPLINNEPQCVNIRVSPRELLRGTQDEIADIIDQINYKIPHFADTHIGIALIWGHGRPGMDEGVQIAQAVRDILKEKYGQAFRDAATKSLYFNYGDVGNIQLEFYFFSDSPMTSIHEEPCSIAD